MSRTLFVGQQEYFPGIGQVQYEGPGSDNPLSFKAYDVMSDKELTRFMQDIKSKVDKTVAGLPNHQTYLEQYCKAMK